MNDNAAPKRIEPESWLSSPALEDPVLAELAALPVAARLFVALFMTLVAMVLATTGLVLGTISHWVVWIVVLGVVEPLALFLLLGALYCLLPASSLGRFLAFAYHRAKMAVWVVITAAVLATVVGLAWVGWLWFTGST